MTNTDNKVQVLWVSKTKIQVGQRTIFMKWNIIFFAFQIQHLGLQTHTKSLPLPQQSHQKQKTYTILEVLDIFINTIT